MLGGTAGSRSPMSVMLAPAARQTNVTSPKLMGTGMKQLTIGDVTITSIIERDGLESRAARLQGRRAGFRRGALGDCSKAKKRAATGRNKASAAFLRG